MKIISKFNDYYDTGLKFGVDSNLKFYRIFVEDKIDNELMNILKNCNEFDNLFLNRTKFEDETSYDNFILVYLGNIYNGIRELLGRRYHYEYTDELNSLINNQDFKLEFYRDKHMKKIKNMLNNNPINKFSDYFIKRNIVFMYLNNYLFSDGKIHVIYNYPNIEKREVLPMLTDCSAKYRDKFYTLRSLEFFRVKDAYTAFNEISMYIGGILSSKENNIININDKDILKKKGFDDMSFKKLPNPNKKGKIRNKK